MNKEIDMAINKTIVTVVTILLTVLTIANTWALALNVRTYNEKQEMIKRIETLEKTSVNQRELETTLMKVIQSELNKFELRMQKEYHIIPK